MWVTLDTLRQTQQAQHKDTAQHITDPALSMTKWEHMTLRLHPALAVLLSQGWM